MFKFRKLIVISITSILFIFFSNAYAESVQEIIASAQKGNTDAQNKLGNMYYDGKGVAQDYNESLRWYKKAAKTGNIEALNNVGLVYSTVLNDGNMALYWYDKALKQGDVSASNRIGMVYLLGKNGVKQDYKEAMRWFEKATKLGIKMGPLI